MTLFPDPLDLDQWYFRVLDRATLDRVRRWQQEIALNPLNSLVRRATGRSITPYGKLAEVIHMLGD